MSPESGLNSWFQKGRVEMDIARLRALLICNILHARCCTTFTGSTVFYAHKNLVAS